MEIVKSSQEMQALGECLGEHLRPGDVLLLKGDLGSGKTTLTQGIAKGLKIDSVVNSPTFVLINEYIDGRITLYHMDLYRLEDPSELDDLGLEDYFYGKGVCVVEWPELAEPLLPETYAVIHIERNGHLRELSLSVFGDAAHIKGAYDEYFGL